MKFTDRSAESGSAGTAIRESVFTEDASYSALLFSLAASIAASREGAPIVVSFSGAQGSGKTTMAGLLSTLLKDLFSLSAVNLSLDDFYLTRSEREKLAVEIHPMLLTRGVPGTHDVAWMSQVIESLVQGETVAAPVFDKASDDRKPETTQLQPVDVIICEGWCWGAVPEPESRLKNDVNALETELDPEGVWRQYVNRQLGEYQSLFANDGHIYLKVPAMEAVYRWRWQQEQELSNTNPDQTHVMTENEVRRFIGYYERLTRWMMEDLPARADVCVELGDDHRISEVLYR